MTKRQGKSGTINIKAVVAEDEEFLRVLVRAALVGQWLHEEIDLERIYAEIWKDAAAVRYLQAYEPLHQSLEEYLQGGAPRFEQFLQAKVSQLEQYLNGM